MAGPLANSVGASLRAGANALERGALVHESLGNHQVAGLHAVVVRGIGNRTREHFAHRFTRSLWSEPQHVLRVSRLHPTDEVDDAPCLHGRDADVPRLGPGFHCFPLARSS